MFFDAENRRVQNRVLETQIAIQNILAAFQHVVKQTGERHDLGQRNAFNRNRSFAAGGFLRREQIDERRVELDHAHRVVHDHHRRRHFLDERIGLLVRELAHIGHAHRAFGFLAEQRDTEFAARVVAAPAAIALIGG